MLRFASLASGSQGNCLVAHVPDVTGGTHVMIDCGLNLRDTERRLARIDLEPSDIDAILVTHEHGDHAGCVFDFAAAHNVVVVGMGMMTFFVVSIFPNVFSGVPQWAQPPLSSPLVLATLVALALNLVFRLGIRRKVTMSVDPAKPEDYLNSFKIRKAS